MSRINIIFTVTLTCILALMVLVYKMNTSGLGTEKRSHEGVKIELTSETLELVIQQRNNLSRELNRKQQMVGRYECEESQRQKGTKNKEATSKSGGWCKSTSKEDSGNHATDKGLATALATFLKSKRVGSFGDGPGRYKQLLLDSGLVKVYDAYDGAPFCEEVSQGRVTYLDLTLPQYGLPLYDWIISLEVAEHIPPKFENIYIDNIIRHALEGVILSWATPGQVGLSHVNNRPVEYVRKLFESLNFSHDDISSNTLRKASSKSWFKRNIHVYRRKNKSDLNKIHV